MAIAPADILPETGFYAATNSFPQNTVIRVTNLENEKAVDVTVRAGLNNPSLLILLSKEAAAAISLPSQYTGRVRIMQSSDAPLAFSAITEGKISSGDPDYDPTALLATSPLSSTQIPDATPLETRPEEASTKDDVIDVPEDYEPPSVITTAPETPIEETIAEEMPPETPIEETIAEETPPETPIKEPNPLDNADLVLVPSQERPPQGKMAVPEGPEVAPIEEIEKTDGVPPTDPQYSGSYFSAPVISLMEKGKFYIQLMSFRKPELVGSAITTIRKAENTDKLIIQSAELNGQPIYRILLGPMDRNESQTLLQKFKKSGYVDAFVWIGK
ncbi:MAG: SPOR domain-containing protein [Treponema sp.]|nr:SPOR domain-containing protein [Treponema sp.]